MSFPVGNKHRCLWLSHSLPFSLRFLVCTFHYFIGLVRSSLLQAILVGTDELFANSHFCSCNVSNDKASSSNRTDDVPLFICFLF